MLSIFFLLLYFGYSQEKLTLEEAIRNCLLNNYEINIVKKDVEISGNNISWGNAGMLPTIDARAGFRYNNPNRRIEFAGNINPPIVRDGANVENINYSVEMNWTLFDGFAMFSNYEKLKSFKELSNIQMQLMIENKVQEVVNNYLNVLNLQENIKTLKQSLELSTQRINMLKDQIDYGVASKSQLLQAQVDYNADSSALLGSELTLATSIRALNYSMGLKVESSFFVDNNINLVSIGDFEEVKEKVFQKNSNINLALENKRLTELDYDIILANFYPRLNLVGDYAYNRTRDDANFTTLILNRGPSVALNASWNLFNANRNSVDTQNNRIEQERDELEINNIKSSIELNLINLWDSYQRQQQILNLEVRNYEISKENYERANEEFNFSRITSIELRQAQINLVLSENRITTSKTELKNIECQIYLLMGELPE